jgi:hypothetical protein
MPISISEDPEGAVVSRNQRFGSACLLDACRHFGQRQLAVFMRADAYSRGFLCTPGSSIIPSTTEIGQTSLSPAFRAFVSRRSGSAEWLFEEVKRLP